MLPGDSFLYGHFNSPVSGYDGETVKCADRPEKNNFNGKTQGITSQEVSAVLAEKGESYLLSVISHLYFL